MTLLKRSFVLLFLLCPYIGYGQEVHQDLVATVRAEVIEVVREEERDIIGTDAIALVQTVRAVLREGENTGDVVEFEQDYAVLAPGDRVFLNHLRLIDGSEYYELKDFDRRGALTILGGLFVLTLALIAGRQGMQALLSLIGSIAAIIFILVPLLLAGYDPAVASVCVAGIVLALAIFITHGFTVLSATAFCGTFLAVVITGTLSALWVEASKLTGFASDASVYLNFSTHGALDFSGLLLGSIMIGILGILDDVAVTQSSITRELVIANPSLSPRDLYVRALRVGRDHIGSLVNTLAFAYVGASLPLVLLFARTDAGIGMIINQEIVASELVRTFVGSIGLMLAVPLTTAIAVWWFKTRTPGTPAPHAHHIHHL